MAAPLKSDRLRRHVAWSGHVLRVGYWCIGGRTLNRAAALVGAGATIVTLGGDGLVTLGDDGMVTLGGDGRVIVEEDGLVAVRKMLAMVRKAAR